MNKRDIVLAQKAIAARQVKEEQKAIKALLQQSKRHAKSTPDLSRSLDSSLNPFRTSNYAGSLDRTCSTPALPDIYQHQQMSSPSSNMKHCSSPRISSPIPSSNSNDSGRRAQQSSRTGHQRVSLYNEKIAQELSKRAVTSKTGLRKLQTEVKKRHEQQKMLNSRASTAAGSTRDGTQGSFADIDDNIFMPKKTIRRSDGASLSDIYASKKADAWGTILKAQLRDEEIMNRQKKRQQEEANDQYGSLLKQQVADSQQRKRDAVNQNNDFAALEDARAKQTEDLQKRREQEAIERHKQFIAHTLEDIETKRTLREKYLTEELMAGTMMVDKAKEAIRQEEQKRQEDKQYHKRYQEQVFHDNAERLARKAKEKADSWAMDRRIIEENERQYRMEQKRRADDLARKMNRFTEGPAHFMTERILEERKHHDDEFYNTYFQSDNMLSKQLKQSEGATRERMTQNGADMTVEWLRHSEWKVNKKKEDEERNSKIMNTMRKMLADQEAEDRAKRKAQVEAAARYQRELDQQLADLRQRSFDSLSKTMSEQEKLYNSDLLRKMKVEL